MSKMVLICGPQAVGKMTVGQELTKITNLKFMHNHDTIDLPLKFFEYESEQRKKLTDLFRFAIFEEVAKSDLEGMIFTVVLGFECKEDMEWVDKIKSIFESNNGEFYFIELEADLDERIKRNKTENRLQQKPTKRNLEFSEKELLESIDKHRLNSNLGEITYKNYLRVNNTNLLPEETAKLIKEKFNL